MNHRQRPGEIVRSLTRLLRGKPKVAPALEDNVLLQTILHRRSVRSFSAEQISDDVFDAILEAGRVAPSTVNLQTWSFAAFDQVRWREKFGRNLPFRAQRAVMIIADTHRVRDVLDVFPESPLFFHTVGVMNASLAAMNMNIAAEALGVSSVMLSETGQSGLLDIQYLKEKLNLPEDTIPLMTIVFGYARGGNPPMPPKLPSDQIIFSGSYPDIDHAVMEDWLSQMVAGYNASHLGSSFDQQIRVYQDKIGQSETELNQAIYHRQKKSE